MVTFTIQSRDGAARAGLMQTPHGPVETPRFMPVGTQGTVKAMTPEELKSLGASIVLGNTYHLHLRPGEALIRQLGGLHRFMHWDGAILTDSGGYQVVSLSEFSQVREEGVAFRSHLDGSPLFLSPEKAIEIQQALGSDIMMALDRPIPATAPPAEVEAALALTTRWAERCKAARESAASAQGQALFGIIQGGTDPALRRRSAEEIAAIGFDGYALGGLSLGESSTAIHDTVAFTAPLLPDALPRYLMGMGEPEDLLMAVGAGVDLFDCVLPTRNARNGTLYTRAGRLNIKASRFADDPEPVEPGCPCYTCRHYSRAYLRHLHMAKEILSMRLNTTHNLHFYLQLLRDARRAIQEGRFGDWRTGVEEGYRRNRDALP